PAGIAALRAESEAHNLSIPARRSLAARPVRLQARPAKIPRHGPPRFGAHGAAPHGHDLLPGEVPYGTDGIQVRPVRTERHLDQRTAAPYGEDCRRDLHHPNHADRCHQSRSGRHVLSDRLPTRGPAKYRLLDLLWPREREPGSPGICGYDFARSARVAIAG